MDPLVAVEAISPHLREALSARGYSSLTAVQEAVLHGDAEGHDLRISSKTGSGKTVALGIVIARTLLTAGDEAPAPGPRALVITPTRELATQVQAELTWLLKGLNMRVACVTGGTNIRTEISALATKPTVLVATPGRLVDHLDRGRLDVSGTLCVVLDEADQMLDLGFRDALETILGKLPAERRTHLVSATFSRDVLRLAQRYQTEAVSVEGTPLGGANEDIEHQLHLCPMNQRLAAIINLLLMHPGEQSLIFVRTRADTGDLCDALGEAGITAAPLSGDMDQNDRTRTLNAFRSGRLKTLVATDVAARGIDVQDIARVIHSEPPTDAETYVHRSGRTGRAGKKGLSHMLVPPQMQGRAVSLLRRAKLEFTWAPLPSAEEVLRAADERLFAELSAPRLDSEQPDARSLHLATRLLRDVEPLSLVVRLLARSGGVLDAQPRTIHAPPPPTGMAQRGPRDRADGPGRGRYDEGPRARFDDDRPRAPRAPRGADDGSFVGFRVSWGAHHGADARRLLAMICRRGDIQGGDVGSIRIGPIQSTFEVRGDVAERFAAASAKPDSRDPRIRFDRANGPRAPRPRPSASAIAAPPQETHDDSEAPPKKPAPKKTFVPSPAPRAEDDAPSEPRAIRKPYAPRAEDDAPSEPRAIRKPYAPRAEGAPYAKPAFKKPYAPRAEGAPYAKPAFKKPYAPRAEGDAPYEKRALKKAYAPRAEGDAPYEKRAPKRTTLSASGAAPSFEKAAASGPGLKKPARRIIETAGPVRAPKKKSPKKS